MREFQLIFSSLSPTKLLVIEQYMSVVTQRFFLRIHKSGDRGKSQSSVTLYFQFFARKSPDNLYACIVVPTAMTEVPPKQEHTDFPAAALKEKPGNLKEVILDVSRFAFFMLAWLARWKFCGKLFHPSWEFPAGVESGRAGYSSYDILTSNLSAFADEISRLATRLNCEPYFFFKEQLVCGVVVKPRRVFIV